MRNLTVVAGRHHKVFAAFASIRPGNPNVADKSLPIVVEEAEHTWRHLDDGRSVFCEVGAGEGVERRGVGC